LTMSGGGLTWATVAPGGVTSVTAGTPAASTGTPLVITPTTGAVVATSNSFAGNANVGHVPDSSAASQTTAFLRADGTWQVPAGGGGGDISTYVVDKRFTMTKNTAPVNEYHGLPAPFNPVWGPGVQQGTLAFSTADAPTVASTWTLAQLNSNLYHKNVSTGCDSTLQYEQICSLEVTPTIYSANITSSAIQMLFQVYKWNTCTYATPVLAAEIVCEVGEATDSAGDPITNVYQSCCRFNLSPAANITLDDREGLGFVCTFPTNPFDGGGAGQLEAIFNLTTRLIRVTP